MKHPYLHAIYCDDIRLELGSKQSLMGVYTGELLVPRFPATMAKLCAIIEMHLPSETTVESFKIECYLEDKVLARTEMDVADLHAMQNDPVNLPKKKEWMMMAVSFIFSPLIVEGNTKIRASAFVNGEEYKAASLMIREQTLDEKKNHRLPFEISAPPLL